MGKYGKESENAPARCRTFAFESRFKRENRLRLSKERALCIRLALSLSSAKGAGVHSGGQKIISVRQKKNFVRRNEDYDRRHRHPSRSNGHLIQLTYCQTFKNLENYVGT